MRKILTLTIVFIALSFSAWAQKKQVLVMQKKSAQFEMVFQNLDEEIRQVSVVQREIISAKISYTAFKNIVVAKHPDLLVVMDNHALNLALRLRQETDSYLKALPCVASMALNLKAILADKKGFCGIAYEVPPFSILTQFRQHIKKDIKTVLVHYRASEHAAFIEDAKAQLAKEGITLRAIDVEALGGKAKDIQWDLKRSLNKEARRRDVDVVLVLLDNILINRENLKSTWLPISCHTDKLFISGIEAFSHKKLDFCVFSSHPDHEELGRQLGQMVLAIVEDGESSDRLGIEYILSVKKSLNRELLWRKGVELDEAL